jgi:hypothetical protein
LAAWEENTTAELVAKKTQRRLYTSLYHADLPKLDQYGLLTFAPNTGKVAATKQLERITPLLTVAQSMEQDDYERFCRPFRESESNDDTS